MAQSALRRRKTSTVAPHRRAPWLRRYSAAAAIFVGLLALLQWGLPVLDVPAYLLPTPTQVLAQLVAPDNRLPFHTVVTALEGVGGFVLGSVVGFLLAVVFIHSRPIEDALYPWVLVTQTVPLVAIAPVLVIWFGNGIWPRVVMSALFAFFPVLVNSARGLRHASREQHDLLCSYHASHWQMFWLLRFPRSLPFLFTGLKIAATLAIVGALVSEFAGSGAGLGFVITISTYHLETARTFAAVVCAALLGMGLYLALVALERRVVFWQRDA